MNLLSAPELHIAEFQRWLPGELTHAARKAGYKTRPERSARPTTDPTSMYGFLGQEWLTHRNMRMAGSHHADKYAATAQAQLAKFANGLFDKAAFVDWVECGERSGEDGVRQAAKDTARAVQLEQPWRKIPEDIDVGKILHSPFEETPFAPGIEQLMADTVAANESRDPEALAELWSSAFQLGGLATACYVQYASEYLMPDQARLADSPLAI